MKRDDGHVNMVMKIKMMDKLDKVDYTDIISPSKMGD